MPGILVSLNAAVVAAALLLAAGTAVAQPATYPAGREASSPRDIKLHGDKLTVRVTDVQVEEILQAITAPSKADILGTVKEPRAVTIDFTDVPLQDGIGRLLGAQNFVLTYREDGSLRGVTLLGGPIEPSTEARIVKNKATSTTQPPALTAAEVLQHSVPVTGKLRQFIGQPTATLQQLMDISTRQEDAALRLEAVRAGMHAIDSAPELKSAVVKSLEGMDDSVLTNLLRNIAQDRANEIVAQVAAASRTPEIRTRGLQVLRTLNTPTAPDETP